MGWRFSTPLDRGDTGRPLIETGKLVGDGGCGDLCVDKEVVSLAADEDEYM